MEIQKISGGDAVPIAMSQNSQMKRDEPADSVVNYRKESAESENRGLFIDRYA